MAFHTAAGRQYVAAPAQFPCPHLPSPKEPGELQNNVANTQLTDELLAHQYFRRLAGFANGTCLVCL